MFWKHETRDHLPGGDMHNKSQLKIISESCEIIIPTRNRPELLGGTLDRIIDIGLGAVPLLVYDDASDAPEAVLASITKRFPDAGIVRGTTCRGQAYGRNALLKQCSRPWVICLEDDSYPIELGDMARWLSNSTDRNVAAVGFQCRDKATGRTDEETGTTKPELRPCFLGGAVMFNRNRILSVGGYREFWRYGFEEPELALRLFGAGLQIWYDPSVLIEHNHVISAIARRNQEEYLRLYVRNAYLMHALNVSWPFGALYGLASAMRQARQKPNLLAHATLGLLDGLLDGIRYGRRKERMGRCQFLQWRNWRRRIAAVRSTAGVGEPVLPTDRECAHPKVAERKP
jgi:GT2 family glycosyltransferase